MGDSVVLQQREQKSLFSTDRNRQKTERERARKKGREGLLTPEFFKLTQVMD